LRDGQAKRLIGLLLNDEVNGAVHWRWHSDKALAERDAANQAAYQARSQAWIKSGRSVATWSGIPPLPLSESSTKTATATTHCTVTDAVDHVVARWMTKQDCQAWMQKATELSASGPTPQQVHMYLISQCLSRTQGTQSYSGQFWRECDAIVVRERSIQLEHNMRQAVDSGRD
jgi:hypothetical protein